MIPTMSEVWIDPRTKEPCRRCDGTGKMPPWPGSKGLVPCGVCRAEMRSTEPVAEPSKPRDERTEYEGIRSFREFVAARAEPSKLEGTLLPRNSKTDPPCTFCRERGFLIDQHDKECAFTHPPVGVKLEGRAEPMEEDVELELSQAVRLELFLSHPCSGKYGDDGEMQCNQAPCFIDFKRDFPSEILAKSAIHRLLLNAKQNGSTAPKERGTK